MDDSRKYYISPEVELIEISYRSFICDSLGGTQNFDEDEEDLLS